MYHLFDVAYLGKKRVARWVLANSEEIRVSQLVAAHYGKKKTRSVSSAQPSKRGPRFLGAPRLKSWL